MILINVISNTLIEENLVREAFAKVYLAKILKSLIRKSLFIKIFFKLTQKIPSFAKVYITAFAAFPICESFFDFNATVFVACG